MPNEKFFKKIATVIIEDTLLDKELDYLIPDELLGKINPGSSVEIPMRSSLKKGVVLSLKEKSEFSKLKSIRKILPDEEKISKDLFQLTSWIATYYGSSLSKVLSFLIFPKSIRKKTFPKTESLIEAKKSKKELLALYREYFSKKQLQPQAKVIDVLLRHPKPISLQKLLQFSQVSESPIESLIKKKVLEKKNVIKAEENILENQYFIPTLPKILSDEQKECFEKITLDLETQKFKIHLIFGVTGSGKTEIYLQLIQKALENQKSVLVLVPEIALTPQTIEKFRGRFPKEPLAIFHHKRSDGEKYQAWKKVESQEAKIVIGTRSAIFAPVQNLGLIIIDEEHDTSYKQTEKSPTFHARHLAMMRAKLFSCPVVLGSATPSFESFYQAKQNFFTLHKLTHRPSGSFLPSIQIVNMQKEEHALFSRMLLNKIEEKLSKGEQSLLFLNRRGFHSHLLCLSCSSVVKCPHCDVSLTFHKKESLLLCHSCGYSLPPLKKCPTCQEEGFFKYKGFGTEMVESALHAIFPHIQTLRVDRDTTQTKHSHEELLKKFRSGKADVLIGTQMIAKGLHFPQVTLVGVLSCDAGLTIPDFRSSEYVFQKIIQVAGRAGRGDVGGEVILQTYLPDHPTIRLAKEGNFEAFFEKEIEERKSFGYPPFTKMVKFLFSGDHEEATFQAAKKYQEAVVELLPKHFEIHPVTPSGKTKIQDRYHFHFLIRGEKPLGSLLAKIKATCSLSSSNHIQLLIDVDPVFTFF